MKDLPVVEFVDIHLSFQNKSLFKNFNLRILTGDKVLISGHSGIGKTSLIRLLLGFVQPESGKLMFKGEMINPKYVWEVRKNIAYVSQDLDFGEGLVTDFFKDVFQLKSNNIREFNKQKLFDLLDYFRLENNILDKEIESLSGGEKQRIAIINAILLNRELYLLDEITSGLDKEVRKKTIEYFLKADLTAIIISHDREWLDNPGVREIRLGEEL